MSGRLIAVVGPSGVGKDTVMRALAARAELGLVRRVITRTDAVGEDCDVVSADAFARRRAAGAFLLDWEAHGLSYGIPVEVRAALAERDMLVNLSRRVLERAAALVPGFMVISLTAAPEVLAERLAARGREDAADQARRLARRVELPEGLHVVEIDNGGPLERTVETALAALYPVRA
ncbi:phosphonate metabolism protein/1,5-bisphosphokinase (PRPP-forming) PhnN [Pontivivens ytuae]|uniref:Ribose 1,5-bisphosphate phosphokinase PhnN n=1 Tax=Pontivivens ytuae TaxID=2789856 RepID=A0A7S9LNZ8_9RHOB|nr:phosphonate metabolism protein/1,5-bisphosphokinase (PRPP-forming) PhnN [Pontivivens ytuae]QPH52588.1 phosphonate metabolism protein/1,5-bisphosphokinase (PRPP-forming) PhnN [Pontivivens ytuae]